MSSRRSPLVPLTLAALTSIGVALGINHLGNEAKVASANQVAAIPVRPKWTATAPGRVEPKGGEVRIFALSAGRIEDVLVRANDKVVAGDLLVRLDDVDAIARQLGADAEAGVRKRERDGETTVPRLAQERRAAEDKLNNTERTIALARGALDRVLIARRANPSSVSSDQVAAARSTLDVAVKQLELDREAHRQSQLAPGVPLPTRLEAGLTASRAELSVAEAALERTRIRAPFDGTILQVNAIAGEAVAASSEQPMIVIGNTTSLRVRAEVEERDVTKVRIGQPVVLKTDAFGDTEFQGRVVSMAQSMRPPKLAQRGPRRPTDLDSLEVMIDVDTGTSLLPGMRVDVFFKAEPPETPKPEPAKVQSGPVKDEAQPAPPATPVKAEMPKVEMPKTESERPEATPAVVPAPAAAPPAPAPAAASPTPTSPPSLAGPPRSN